MFELDPPALLVLPGPISTNALFSNVPGRGRVMSREYKAWKKVAEQTLAAQRPLPRFALPVSVTFYVGERHVGQMDSDNTLKAYIDAIKTAGVIHDDSRRWVRRTAAIWVPAMGGCVARIRVAEMDINAAALRDLIAPRLQGLI